MSSPDPVTPAHEAATTGKPSLQVVNQTQGDNGNELERRITALEKGEKSLWKRTGMILGVIGGLVAIATGLHGLWVALYPTPRVVVAWQRQVQLTYDKQSDSFNLVYLPSISNDMGTAEDRVMSVSVEIQGPQSVPYPVGFPNVTLVEDNPQRIPIRTIGKGVSKDAQLNVSLKQSFLVYLLADPGLRETDVNFSLESKGLKPVVEKKKEKKTN